jgi:hypothetical protein
LRYLWCRRADAALDRVNCLRRRVSPGGRAADARSDQAWVNSKLTPQPLGPTFTPNKFTGAREKVAKKTYIRALGYSLPSFDKWLAQCKADPTDPTWHTHSIDCGHDIMVDRPDELTELLIAAG